MRSLPLLMTNNNNLVLAETGSGKTLAYLIPLLNHLLKWKSDYLLADEETKEKMSKER